MLTNLHITPSVLQGALQIPSSKSHTLRAILFGALAKGRSNIKNPLTSPDTQAMLAAVEQLGAKVIRKNNSLEILGFAGSPQPAQDIIQCGNSGLVLRLIGALSALIPHYTILTGDASIRKNRLAFPLLDALKQLGVFAASSLENGYAPLIIKGPLLKDRAVLDGQDSQPVSGLLIAGAFAPHSINLHVKNPGETPWIDLTLDWFQRVGISFEAKDYTDYRTKGKEQIDGFSYSVSGDFSTAAFPLAAALLTNSELRIQNLDFDDVQGDKQLISVLVQMGAKLSFEKGTLIVEKNQKLRGMQIDVNPLIDAIPILAVIACFAEGDTELKNGAIARSKESDRISAIARELSKMGADIEEIPDGLIIHPSRLHGAHLISHHDHRIAMSLAVAGLAATSSSTIEGVECIAKTYPNFVPEFQKLGASIRGF